MPPPAIATTPPAARSLLRRSWLAALPGLLLLTPGCGGAAQAEPTSALASAPLTNCDASLEPEQGTTYYYVAPDGDDQASGSCREPMASLQAVEAKIRAAEKIQLERGWPKQTLQNAYTVYVRGGTYTSHVVDWRVAPGDPTKWMRILAYPGERPIFDGEGKANIAFSFEIGLARRTNFQLSGLTWKHYRNGVKVQGRRSDKGALLWTGGAVISHNVLDQIGDVYDAGDCAEFMKRGKHDICYGNSVVGIGNARYNTIEHNILVRGESRDSKTTFGGGSRAVMHALYLSEYSHDNIIRDNYIRLISGSAIKLRWGSSNNQIYRNYIADSGQKAFVSCWFNGVGRDKAPCVGNVIKDNVFTFGYPEVDSKSFRCLDPVVETLSEIGSKVVSSKGLLVDQGNAAFSGIRPRNETIAAMARGDLDGDGRDEVIVAFNYGSQFSKIVASDGITPYLSRVIYAAPTSTFGRITALATGRFDSSGRDQLVVSWENSSQGTIAEVWRGDGSSLVGGVSGAQNLGPVFRERGWVVEALAAGDFEGSGQDRLLMAMRGNDRRTSIFSGDGKSKGSLVFGPDRDWSVLAMTAGDLDGDGKDALYTAFERRRGAGAVTIYQGDDDDVQDDALFEANGTEVSALAVSSRESGRFLYAALQRGPNALAEVRRAKGEEPGTFAEVEATAASGAHFTAVVLPNSSGQKPTVAMQSAQQNVVSDGDNEYYRWDKPTRKVKCSGR